MEIYRHSTGVKFEGRTTTWYCIDEVQVRYVGEGSDFGSVTTAGIPTYVPGDEYTLYLMESEYYGDEAAWLIVDSKGNIVDDECYDDIVTYIESTLSDDWEVIIDED